MSKGFFLVLGGIGGSGKTSLCKRIASYCLYHGIPHITTFEPGGTPAANYLRKLCREGLPDCEPLTPMAEAMLFNAARAQHVETVIRPALAEGKVVICDRFAETTYAYQGAARGAHIFNLQQVHHYAIGLNPDLTIILDGDAEVFMARVSDTEKLTDKFDAMAVSVQERMQEYLYSLVECDNTGGYVSVEADGTREELWEQVLPYLEKIRLDRIRNTVPHTDFSKGIEDRDVGVGFVEDRPVHTPIINSILKKDLSFNTIIPDHVSFSGIKDTSVPDAPPLPEEPKEQVDKNWNY